MDLPTEMRITICNFALQHILGEVHDAAPADKRLPHAVKKPRDDPDGVPFYTGALALIHTNRTIRAESLDALASRMLAHVARFEAEIQNDDNNVVLKEVIRRSPGFEFEAFQALLIMSYERGGEDRQARRYSYSSEVHLLEDGLDEGWLVRKA